MPHSDRGSLWSRWDLHFHTPSSHDYGNKGVTNEQIIERLIAEEIHVVAITDHNTVDVDRISNLQKLAKGRITVLPGIELRSELGGKEAVHFIGIFPDDCDLKDVWTKLSAKCSLTPADIKKRGHDNVYCDLIQTVAIIHELGGVVSIHGHGKANSIEGIANSPAFKAQLKTDLLRDHIDILEIGVAERQEDYEKIVFPTIKVELPLIVGSDNHDITAYSARSSCWVRADPNFRGLRMLLCEPRDRRYLGDIPPQLIRVSQNKTKYINSVSFHAEESLPAEQKWFEGKIDLNPGLIAIVGNKGSGKSALADTLGLLGDSKNSSTFSFLSGERFCHPSDGFAQHFSATIEWEDGTNTTRAMNDMIEPEAVERIKYLPQDHVEEVCNELSGGSGGGFENELKSVIFSHVPDDQRLKYQSLDELVRFQTEEKQTRIDSLIKSIREVSRRRAALEVQTDPGVRKELEEKVKQRELELSALMASKPAAKTDPSLAKSTSVEDKKILTDLETASTTAARLRTEIVGTEKVLVDAERRYAVAQKLLDRLTNFEKEFVQFRSSLSSDAAELELNSTELAVLNINREPIVKIRDAVQSLTATARQKLETNEPPGLRSQLSAAMNSVNELQARLDGPNREYQSYLKILAEWQARNRAIVGAEGEPESLEGLKASIAKLALLLPQIDMVRKEHEALAMQIHEEKLAQVAVYRELYTPVQRFIDEHPLARHKLKLEFRAELINDAFAERLLSFINQNRVGSFMGTDEGKAFADAVAKTVKWEDSKSVELFLRAVDNALHFDLRSGPPKAVQLKDQLIKGKKIEELFDALYALEYINPRYILRWEGKDLSVLSPGERGTLLLVFYLLMDKGEIPLVIDQPEGNLDNHTVAKALVDCIKEARNRRQVFIVTHNPNLAVVCDADQVIHATMHKEDGSRVQYDVGALENPAISKFCTDVLEGTIGAFNIRGDKYEVCREIATAAKGLEN